MQSLTDAIPDALRPFIAQSRVDTNRFKVLDNPLGLAPGTVNAQGLLDLINVYKLRADSLYRANTNERRAQEAAQRKAYRAHVNAMIQAQWTLLDLPDGARATITIGDTSIEVVREGSKLVVNL